MELQYCVSNLDSRMNQIEPKLKLIEPKLANLEMNVSLAQQHQKRFIWILYDYSKHKEAAHQNRYRYIESPHFYMGSCGYSMSCRVYLNKGGIVFFIFYKLLDLYLYKGYLRNVHFYASCSRVIALL